MSRIYPEQLSMQLQKSLCQCYLLFGNDPFLLQESLDKIRHRARIQQFNECLSVRLNTSTNWDTVFEFCQTFNMFSNRQILLLIFPESGITTSSIDQLLLRVVLLLHEDLLLILQGCKLNHSQESSAWFKKILRKNLVLVNCSTPEETQLPKWIINRANNMKLTLDNVVCHLLCYYYEGNLLALVQVLEQLSLIYPNGGNLTIPRIQSVVHDAAYFTPFHWVDAALAGKKQRAVHILQQLRQKDLEPTILLHSMQREVLLLLTLKRQMTTTNIPIHTLFNQHKIWQYRRALLIQALNRLTLVQLRDVIAMMSKIELAIKQNRNNYFPWLDLKALILLLYGDALPTFSSSISYTMESIIND